MLERTRADYVDAVTDEKLIESAINGMLSSLDPHSGYLNKKSFQDMQTQTKGEFGGLGIEVTQENGLIKVVSPIDDTPAAKAGLQPNDLITHIDNKPVTELTLNEAVDHMRGTPGTKITLTIRRGGISGQPFDVSLTRAVIKIQSVKWEVKNDVAYIRVTTFNEQTQIGLDKALAEAEQKMGAKLSGYVLDLRNNPGGLLDQAFRFPVLSLRRARKLFLRAVVTRKRTNILRPRAATARTVNQCRFDQRRFSLGFGNRCRRAARSSSRDPAWHQELWQRFRADNHSDCRRGRDAFNHGALLHAFGSLDPATGH